MENGLTQISDLAAMLEACETVDIRLALVRTADGWQVRYGEVVLGLEAAPEERTWRYRDDAFLQRRVPGPMMAGLLREEPQPIAELKITAPTPQNGGRYERLPGQANWNHAVLPWPRTEWDVSWLQTPSTRPRAVLVGDGPAFLHVEAAFCAFFYDAPPDSNLNQSHRLWRIVRVDRRAWIHQVTISPDTIRVTATGTRLNDVQLELTTPTTRIVRPVGTTGRVQLRLPRGLSSSTLVMLHAEDDWLDFRYFASPVPRRGHDQSIVWDLPGAQLTMLIAGGESQYVEFKREVPTGESRKKMVKRVAAFASGEGGAILVGVEDDTHVVGVDPTTLDPQMRALHSMIRDSIDPEPPYAVRAEEVDGKTVLVVEVSAGGRWYAMNPAKPEFYLRRGGSTVPARVDEIAVGFGYRQPSASSW